MDINEKIRIMQAFAQGKPIEFRAKGDTGNPNWMASSTPTWNWDTFDYRVKPGLVAVPYDSVEEVDRDRWLMAKDEDEQNFLARICIINKKLNEVCVDYYGWQTLDQLFDKFLYEDGSQCGKLRIIKDVSPDEAKDIDIPGGRFA